MLPRFEMTLRALLDDRAGASAVEYAMIAALIVIVLIAAMVSIGTSVSGFFHAAGAGL